MENSSGTTSRRINTQENLLLWSIKSAMKGEDQTMSKLVKMPKGEVEYN